MTAPDFETALANLDNEEEMMKHFVSDVANWVVPGAIMAGQTPAKSSSIDETMKSLRTYAGVTTFVCLQAEVSPQTEDGTDFGGTKDGNETEDMPSYAEAARNVENTPEPKFVYYGIRDEEKAESLEKLSEVINDLKERVEKGEVLYIHCKGGTGRTGLIVACLLGRLYPSLSADEALARIQAYCNMRYKGRGKWVPHFVKSPATEGQVEQVKDFLAQASLDKPAQKSVFFGDIFASCIPK